MLNIARSLQQIVSLRRLRLRALKMLGSIRRFLLVLPLLTAPSLSKDARLIVIDADPGADDAMAILMLLSKQSNVAVLAITVASGNTGVDNATINALKTLRVAGNTEVPIYRGSDQGLVFKIETDGFFGEDGLGDFEYQGFRINESQLRSEHAAQVLVQIVRSFPGQISLLGLGPLTNIALALHLYPPLLSRLRELIILGSSYKGQGNVKPGVEFNFYADPEAAAFVLSKITSDCRVTIFPIETVQEAVFPQNWRRSILGSIPSPAIKFLNLAERKSLARVSNWQAYDPMAAAYAIDQSIALDSMKVNAFVETTGRLRGALAINYKSNDTNLRIITKVNQRRLEDILITTLG